MGSSSLLSWKNSLQCNDKIWVWRSLTWNEVSLIKLTGTNSQHFSCSQTGGLLVFFDRDFVEQDERKDWISVLAPLVGGSSLFISQWYKRASKHNIFGTGMGTQRQNIQEYHHFFGLRNRVYGMPEGMESNNRPRTLELLKEFGNCTYFLKAQLQSTFSIERTRIHHSTAK